jgi:hypothetical protein
MAKLAQQAGRFIAQLSQVLDDRLALTEPPFSLRTGMAKHLA